MPVAKTTMGPAGLLSPPAPPWPYLLHPPRRASAKRALLRKHLHHDAAVLRTAVAIGVRRHRLLLAVADHVHLVERHLVLLVEIPLHGFGAVEAEALVEFGGADV